jgi:hypothetical protein
VSDDLQHTTIGPCPACQAWYERNRPADPPALTAEVREQLRTLLNPPVVTG